MLTHRLTGEEREVDIVLKYKLGIHDVLVSIECIDRKRKADSTWVETMAKKHEFLPTSKLVLWSSSGFYKPAIITAEKLGIETVSQNQNNFTEWDNIANIFHNGSLKVVESTFSFFIDVINLDGTKSRLEGPYNYLFRMLNSDRTFSIGQLMQYIMEKQEVGSTLLDYATSENSDFWIHYVPQFKCQVQNQKGEWIEPFRIGFGIKASVEETKPEFKTIKYGSIVATLALGNLKSGSIEVFVEETAGKKPVISSQIIKTIG